MSPEPPNEKPAPTADHESGRNWTSQILNALRDPDVQDEIQYLVRDIVRAAMDELATIEHERSVAMEEAAERYRRDLTNAAPLPGYQERMAERRAERENARRPVLFSSLKPGSQEP